MDINFGEGKTEFGPGVTIELDGNEVAMAIDAYLVSHGIYVRGARTVKVNNELCESGRIHVDPSGFVTHNGTQFTGRGEINE